jgi:tRNA modification GTPase
MDAIVAISTAPGIGGIGIIRMSGKDCFKVLDKIFKAKNPQEIENIKGYTIKYGHIINEKNEIIDEVLVSYFKAPKSYTSENMCEISSHGGTIIMNKILDECMKNGANLAEPGEFTKRAFLSGRMDLSQAEAVIDVINSKTDKESKVAIDQLEGFLSEKISSIRSSLIDLMSDIDANIDYPEYDVEEVTSEKMNSVLNNVSEELKELEESFYTGKILRDGIKTVIIGRPNAGKSSLLNVILNEERAIVTDIEGTTRDTIEEFVQIKGLPLKIIDTAGIRNAQDKVEQIGVDKAIEIAEKSDIIIAIFDISKELNEEDEKIINLIKDRNAIIVLNKIDIIDKKIEKLEKINKPIIKISTKTREGIDKLYEKIAEIFKLNEMASNGEIIISNKRHQYLIKNAAKEIVGAQEALKNNMPVELISSNLRNAMEELGKITGETVTDDVIKQIFSKFCLGK